MKKLAFVLVVLLFASVASAQVISNPTTNARMDGLGVANHQIEDDFNIWINPAQITNYKSGIYGELGDFVADDVTTNDPNQRGVTGAWGGIHAEVGVGTLGVYLGRPYPDTGLLSLLETGPVPDANRFDLFWGFPGMPLGLYLSYANVSTEVKPDETDENATEVNLGVGGLFMDGMLEGALNVGFPSSEDKIADTESDAGPSVALLARHHLDHTGGKFLTTFQIDYFDASGESGGATIDDTGLAWSLDTACNSKPNDDTLLVLGIGIAGGSRSIDPEGGEETKIDVFEIPVNLAVEHQTFKKVKTRFGVSKPIYSSLSCENTDEACESFGTFDVDAIANGAAEVSAGLGWAVHDNLSLDAVINQDVLFSGTYVVSGVPETLSSKISATYRFQ